MCIGFGRAQGPARTAKLFWVQADTGTRPNINFRCAGSPCPALIYIGIMCILCSGGHRDPPEHKLLLRRVPVPCAHLYRYRDCLKSIACPQGTAADNCLKTWILKHCHIVPECEVEDPTLAVRMVERHNMGFIFRLIVRMHQMM